MSVAAFDAMRVAKRLQEDFDMPQRQAEGVADVLNESLVENMVTRTEFSKMGDDMATKSDLERIEVHMLWVKWLLGGVLLVLVLPYIADLIGRAGVG